MSTSQNVKDIVYGAVHDTHDFRYIGFCKKVRSDEVQSVDVWIDGQKVETLQCDKTINKIVNIYNKVGFAFEYGLPEQYIGENHLVSFTCNAKELENSPLTTISKDDDRYNESRFEYSLSEPIDEEKIKDLNSSDAIGFLATEKNLEDKEFIYFVKLLKQQNYGVAFVAFCFNAMQKQRALDVFGQDVEIIIPSTIEDIIQNISVYLYCKLSSDIPQKIDSIVRVKLIQQAIKIFVIDLEGEIVRDDFISKISLPRTDKERSFVHSVVSKIFQGHEKFNEYRFMNSLTESFVDKASKKLENIYKRGNIGFFVIDKYFDKSYIEYLEKLMVKFSGIVFKGICFTDNQKKLCLELFGGYHNFKIITPKDIYEVAIELEVLSIDFRVMHENYSSYQTIVKYLISSFDSIFVSLYNNTPLDKPALKNSYLYEDNIAINSVNYNILETLGLDNQIRELADNNFWLSILIWASQKKIVDYKIDRQLDKFTFYFYDLIELSLKYPYFKIILIVVNAMKLDLKNDILDSILMKLKAMDYNSK